MGNKNQVIRPIHKKARVALVDTHMAINGCQILLAHPDPGHADKVAKEFAGAFPVMMSRSKVPNMQDYYREHFKACEQIEVTD